MKRPNPCKRSDGTLKAVWVSLEEARAVRDYTNRQNREHRREGVPWEPVDAYECPRCGLYHVGTPRRHDRPHRRRQRGSWK